ncbi:MAG TPA: PDZ domain-containing protein [Polyangiales bacterium]
MKLLEQGFAIAFVLVLGAACSSSNGAGHASTATTAGSGGSAGAGGGSRADGAAGGATAMGGASGGTTTDGGSAGSSAGGTGGSTVPAGDIYVSTSGNDSNPGTKDQPLKTIAAAQTAARAHPNHGKAPLTVAVLPGTYYVGKTIVFGAADSGTKDAPVTFRGFGTPTLSGGVSLSLTWSPYKNDILQANVPANVSSGLSFDVLFLNGQRQVMARYPNYDPTKLTTPFQGVANDYQSRPGKWTHMPTGEVYAHCMHTGDWGSQHYVVKNVMGGNLSLDNPLCNGRATGPNGSGVIENALDELDAPGEWYFDKTAGVLYFYPPQGTDLSSALIEVAGLETIIQFQGTSTAPVKWVNFDGFRFNATSRTFAKCSEQILRSDWQIYRGGGLFLSGVEDSGITNSFFDALGGNALFVSGYARRVTIQTNKFVGIGASALLLMGVSSTVRNPVFGYYGGTVAVDSLDKTPGPKTNDYPAQCTVTDNLFHDIGYPQKQVAAVGIDMASEITLSHNSIYNMPRAGINIGDGCWGGHVVEYNDVFDTVLETGDHGSFNSWGRDRFWDPDVGQIESRVGSVPGLELFDAMKPVIIRNNRWRCDRGWDVDLDDGSTNYVITNNIFLAGGLKWREGYQRDGENNMFTEKARMSVHVWPNDNRDVFTHNILNHYDVASPHAWGQTVDYNLFTDAAALNTAHGYGVDKNSVSGSPGYVDAANGNFQLSASSPALALGIKNIPLDSYGVTSLSLRAQARTPSFGATPSPGNPDAGTRDPNPMTWRGAQVKNLIGLDERSATGIGADVGVLVVSVPGGSQAATDGFKNLDVILQFGGQNVVSLDDLTRLYNASTVGQKVTLGIHRNQQDSTLTITR